MTQPTAQNTERPAQAISSRRSRSWWLNLGVALAVLIGVHLWQTRHVPRGAAPEFISLAISTQAGATMSLAQWRAAHPGRPVALHFWAEWCGICRMEEGNVSRVAQDWPVLSVAMRSGDVAAVRRVMGQRGLNWATVIDPNGDVARRYGLGAVPALVVIGPNGQISTTSVGYTTTWGMRARLWWAQWRA
ncbi:redoxin domain-containing protein [Ottowia oryzae]|uniref:redoxin domain-containing protein n=1 Tax=Ottowia oryzae TaxID=2109914 RepID=UPI001FEC3B7B|nr:redoxin domain-containing protein [Ottowia oryzae]